jgi:hypothetical protein
MSVVVVNEMEGADASMYDQVNPKVMPEGRLPDGCQAHIAGPYENGFRVITVWESDERFQQFRDETLLPAIREYGDEGTIAPSITTSEVHNLILS